MKLSACMSSVEVRPESDGYIRIRPTWLVAPVKLTRMAVAQEIQRILDKKLARKVKRG